MRKLILTILIPCLCGFGQQYSPEAQDAANAEAMRDQADITHISASMLEEYINRVYKRLQIVSERPISNYFFAVIDSQQSELNYDAEKQTILISRGLLDELSDEAELAATLSLSVAKFSGEANPDRETVNNLYRAGYDPVAMLDLQEEYFHAAHAGEEHWLRFIYSIPPTAGTITANRLLINNLQPGLKRDTEDYQKQISG